MASGSLLPKIPKAVWLGTHGLHECQPELCDPNGLQNGSPITTFYRPASAAKRRDIGSRTPSDVSEVPRGRIHGKAPAMYCLFCDASLGRAHPILLN